MTDAVLCSVCGVSLPADYIEIVEHFLSSDDSGHRNALLDFCSHCTEDLDETDEEGDDTEP